MLKPETRIKLPDATKPGVGVPARSIVPKAIRYAEAARNIVPRTAANNAILAVRRSLRITRRAVLVIIVFIPVAHPLPYVPSHIIQPLPVCCVIFYRMSVIILAAITFTLIAKRRPAVIRIAAIYIVSVRISRSFKTAPRRVFPLSLSR